MTRKLSWDELHEAARADTILHAMQHKADLLEHWRETAKPGRLAEHAAAAIRFRELFGIHPSQAEAYTKALQNIHRGSGYTVQEIRDLFVAYAKYGDPSPTMPVDSPPYF